MRRYVVHRVNDATGQTEAVGCIVERRRTGTEMRQNLFALLAQARELFGGGQGEAIEFVLRPLVPAAVSGGQAAMREPATVGVTN